MGGIPAADHLESVERVHFSVQGTGSHSAVQSHGEAGRVPGGSVLAVVLKSGAVPT
jgi:hypothetical protein